MYLILGRAELRWNFSSILGMSLIFADYQHCTWLRPTSLFVNRDSLKALRNLRFVSNISNTASKNGCSKLSSQVDAVALFGCPSSVLRTHCFKVTDISSMYTCREVFHQLALADPMEAPGMLPSGCKFFHFRAVFYPK